MRFDLEQFLAITMALGTAGAVGAAVYSTHDAQAETPAEGAASVDEPEEFPEAEPDLPKAPAPAPAPVAAAPLPTFDAPAEELDAVPGPQVESW